MTKVLITEDKSKRNQVVLEYRHNWKKASNRKYAHKLLDKALDRGQYTIQIDESKLETIKYTSTEVFLYDRNGAFLRVENIPINDSEDTTVNSLENTIINDSEDTVVNDSEEDIIDTSELDYTIINGLSSPQYGDKFSRAEGRKYALLNALSKMKFTSKDHNFKDLLALKTFLLQFEIRLREKYPFAKWHNNLITWHYIDLWNALLEGRNTKQETILPNNNIRTAAIGLFGEANYNLVLEECFINLINILNDPNTSLDELYFYYSYTVEDYFTYLKTGKTGNA